MTRSSETRNRVRAAMARRLVIALTVCAALFAPSASLAGGCTRFEAPPLLDQLSLRTGGRFVSIPEALGPRPNNRSHLYDLDMPANGRGISRHAFPDSLAAFLPFEKTGEGLLGKYETTYAWVVLIASWKLGVTPDPNGLYVRNASGKQEPMTTFLLCQSERRYLAAVAEHMEQGRAAKLAMRLFLMGRIADGDGPVWIDGERIGGMDSGNNVND